MVWEGVRGGCMTEESKRDDRTRSQRIERVHHGEALDRSMLLSPT